jgi:hypothetical protein
MQQKDFGNDKRSLPKDLAGYRGLGEREALGTNLHNVLYSEKESSITKLYSIAS